MSHRTALGALVLSILVAACSTAGPPGSTTGGVSGTTGSSAGSTTGPAAGGVVTIASFFAAGSCPTPPVSLAINPSGNFFAVNGTLQIVSLDGGLSPFLPQAGGLVAVAASSAGVFVSEGSPPEIYSVGDFTQSYLAGGSQGCGNSQLGVDGGVGFIRALAVASDSASNVYVADWGYPGCTLIRKIAYDGITSTLAGTGTDGFADGPAASAEFWQPSGIAVDINRNLFVADTANNRIRMITADGGTSVVTTVAGNGFAGFSDATGAPNTSSSGTFNSPTGIAVDASGTIYVADTGNNAIRMVKVSPGDPDAGTGSTTTVTTLAGNGTKGYVDGTLGQSGNSEFDYPLGLAVDKNGNVFVADQGNCRIRMIQQPASN